MLRINKKIHLEQFKTRYPLTYPALKDGSLSLLNKSSLRHSNNANYATIPLGVNEAVCGSYSGFTDDMYTYYHTKTIDYKTLESWYKQFREYYDFLHNNPCGNSYSSATEYWISMESGRTESSATTYTQYIQMDEEFKRHGGSGFFKWLSSYCFLSLDLRYEYKLMESEGFDFSGVTFVDWDGIVDEIGSNVQYYPSIQKLYSRLRILRNKKETGRIDCCSNNTFDNLGGETTIKVLEHWLNRTNVLNIDSSDTLSYIKKWIQIVNPKVDSEEQTLNSIRQWMEDTTFKDEADPYWQDWFEWLEDNGKETRTDKFVKDDGYEYQWWLQMWALMTHPELADETEETDKSYKHTPEKLCQYLIDKITPRTDVLLHLEKKVADFGNYTIFSKEFNASEEYTSGNVVTYNDRYYMFTGSTSSSAVIYNYDNGKYVFNPSSWVSYYEVYKEKNPGEFSDYAKSYLLTGRTESSLPSFLRTEQTVDMIGNMLPGYFEPSSASTFIQPAEEAILDLPFEVGQEINQTYLEDNHYSGDLLYQVKIYYTDSNGVIIDDTLQYCNPGDKLVDKINESVASAQKIFDENERRITISGSQAELIDIYDNTYADFTYYKGCTYSYNKNKGVVVIDSEIIDGTTYTSGIKYIDHCSLQLKTYPYYLTQSEYYPIRYYSVLMDVETIYSDLANQYVDVNMSTFEFYPIAFDKSQNADKDWADKLVAPLIRKEETLGLALPEKIADNIYIDRGYATVVDRYLKIGEVTSCETLEKYGNGAFALINLQEETT